MTTTALFSYRYESCYRPLWMGFDRSLKACGFAGEWKLIEDTGRSFILATDSPLPSEARRQLELTPV